MAVLGGVKTALQQYLSVVNHPKGMSENDVVEAGHLALKLTDSELMSLKLRTKAGNINSSRQVYNEFLSGLIEELIRNKGLTEENTTPLPTATSTKKMLTLSGNVFSFMVVDHDQSNDQGLIRFMLHDARLAQLDLPKLFGRYFKNKKVCVDARVIGVNLVEKVGEGWVLNGLITEVSEEDKRSYGINKKPDMRISENSFVANEDTWSCLFSALKEFTPSLFLRKDFVVSGIASGKIFDDGQSRINITPGLIPPPTSTASASHLEPIMPEPDADDCEDPDYNPPHFL